MDGNASEAKIEAEAQAEIRKPVARPGQERNQNAARHGLYARFFSLDELRLLAEFAGIGGLEAEIAMLRVAMARMMERSDELGSPAELVMASSRGVDSLVRALRLQRELGGNGGTLAGALEAALDRLGLAVDDS